MRTDGRRVAGTGIYHKLVGTVGTLDGHYPDKSPGFLQ
jgi:hypothetical protein